MKILYSAAGTPIPGTHGGSVHALELCRALSRRGHDVHLAALPPSSSGVSQVRLDGVQIHYLRRLLPVTLLEWTARRAIGSLIGEITPDVVVERFYTFGGGAIAAAHVAGVPAVLEINSPARDYPGSLRDRLDKLTVVRPVARWRQRQLARCAATYATSRHLLPPALQDSTTVIVNGVDTERFTPGPETEDTGPLHCVYVSSFRSWHGAEDLVEAVAHCVSRRLPVRATFVGRGPRWMAAKEAAVLAGVEEAIDFVGQVPHAEVAALLAAADIGLAPFAPDQFSALELGWFWSPIKIFEYLAAGLPVVTADIDELRALLPGDVANFYQASDPLALAEAIMELEADRAAVRRMAAAARTLAEECYTWDHQAETVDGVLSSVL